MENFKLTYSTMFAPPRELHAQFDEAVASLRLGEAHGIHINGEELKRGDVLSKLDPADRRRLLGRFTIANAPDVDAAVAAARNASGAWRAIGWEKRNEYLRKVARVVERRIYEISAAVSFEVGKNRLEALGEVAEVVEFFDVFARQMEENRGYDQALADDPVAGYSSKNRSVLKPYGVWAVIVPFNFPIALAAGPTAAALAAGNTVVVKGSLDTPWSGCLLAECLREAGLPAGVFNYILGDGAVVGERLISHDGIDGVTFTGSYEVGMHIARTQLARRFPRPCIAEMGGKNAVIVSAKANLSDAAKGIVRSAYGLSGQKCSALSRVYVDCAVADGLVDQLLGEIRKISVGVPQQEKAWMGPVATPHAYKRFAECCDALQSGGSRILIGGTQLKEGEFEHGYFCAPTLAEAPLDHPLWKREMFAPILMLHRVASKEAGVQLANSSDFGLTAGFYGGEDETEWFFENVDAGVCYSNRPQGATTGAFPGYQAFGGWKGSGSTGKALASYYYLPQYAREQSQTRVTLARPA